jgi:hypothetical protein
MSFVSYVVAAILLAIGWIGTFGNDRLAASLFFIALGLALSMLGGSVTYIETRRGP